MAEVFAPFDVSGPYPLDKRQVFATLKDMRDFDTDHLPNTYFCTCDETGIFYVYNKENPLDPNTGKWRPVEGGGTGEGVKYAWTPAGDVSAIGPTWTTLSAIAGKEYSGDSLWINVDNLNNRVWFSESAQNMWQILTERENAWHNTPVPPSADDGKFYGIINNTWKELEFESYKLSDTVTTALNVSGDRELRSVVDISLDYNGLLNFNNGKIKLEIGEK